MTVTDTIPNALAGDSADLEVGYASVAVDQTTTGAFAEVLGATITVELDPTIFYWLEWQGTVSHSASAAIPFISVYRDAVQLDTVFRNAGVGNDGVIGAVRRVPLGYGLTGTSTFAMSFGRVSGSGTATARGTGSYAPLYVRLLAVAP